MSSEPLHWRADFETGIEDIDFQHHYFLNLINRLARQFLRAEDDDYRAALIAELNAYARFHFISEENLMRRDGYPELAHHRRLHDELIDELSSREQALELAHAEGREADIVEFLVAWFTHHTSQEDRRCAEFRASSFPGVSNPG